MRRLVFGRAARSDLTVIAHYIARRSGSPEVASSFVASLRQQCLHLAALPGQLGNPRSDLQPGLRSFAFGNYLILFHYEPKAFRVARILEGHRDMPRHMGVALDPI